MAEGRIKGITIEIDGDVTGLNKALESTTKELRSTQKQLNDVNRLLKLDPTNTELLSQKQRLLGDAIKSTQDKLETLKKAEEQAAAKLESGGKEAQEQYEALRREIISTGNYLGKLEKQADDTERALGDAGDNGAESIKDAGSAAKDAESKVSGFGSAAKAAGVAAAAAFAAAAAAAISAAKALVDMTVGGAEYADEVLTLSTQTGIATDKLQEYMYAAELVDVSTETLTKSMAKNIKSMKSASDGSAAYAEAYAQLGVSVVDANGALRDGETVYWEAIDALGKIENETERDAIAMQLFGKSAQELNPLIEAGASRMQELGKSAQAAGYVIGDDMLNAYGTLDDQLQYLSVGATAAKNALGTVLLPVLTDLAGEGVDLLGEFTQGIIDANGDISKMSDVVGETLPKVVDAIMQFIPELIEIAGELISSFLGSIINNLPKITDAAVSVGMTLLSGLVSSLPEIITAIVSFLKSILNAIVDNLPEIIDGIIDAAMAIVDALPEIIDAIIAALPKIISALINALPKVIKAIADAISKLAPMLIESGVDLAEALIDGIIDVFSDPVELISAIGELAISIVGSLFDSVFALIRKIDKPSLSKQVLSAFPSEKESQKSGEATGRGFANGISNSRAAIENAANEAAKAVVTEAKIAAQEVEEETAAIISSAAEAAEAFAAMQAQTATDFSETQSYYAHIADLTDELFNLADANGKVEDADRSRVEFILGELNSALGTEYQLVGNVISQYSALEASVYDVIAAKRANTLLDAYSDDYQTAIKNEQSAIDAVSASQEAYNAKLIEFNALQDEIMRQEAIDPESVDPRLYKWSDDARLELAEAENAYLQAVDNLQQYEATVQKYEGAMTKVLEGDYEGAEEVLNNTATMVSEHDRDIIDSRKSATEEYKQDWQDALEAGDYAADRYARTYTDVLEDLNGVYREALGFGDSISDGMVKGLEDGGDPLTVKMSEIISSVIDAAKNEGDSSWEIGENIGKGVAYGLESQEDVVRAKARKIASAATNEMRTVMQIASPSKVTKKYGMYLDDGLIVGLEGGLGEVLDAVDKVSDSVLSRIALNPDDSEYEISESMDEWGAQTFSNYSSVYNNTTSLGGISVYVSAPNVDNVEDLADLVADRINQQIIDRQAVAQ